MGCFQVFATTNGAPGTFPVCGGISVGWIPASRTVGSKVRAFMIFTRLSRYSGWGCAMYAVPGNRGETSAHSLATETSHCSFNFHFLSLKGARASFCSLKSHCISFSVSCLCLHNLCPISTKIALLARSFSLTISRSSFYVMERLAVCDRGLQIHVVVF